MNSYLFNKVGLWGYRHYEYLKQNQLTTINVMRMNGTLESYLKQVNQDAEDMLFQTVKQMAQAEGVNEALKASDQLEWVRRINNIRNRAEEIVIHELIYV
jgi:hypothetical protein